MRYDDRTLLFSFFTTGNILFKKKSYKKLLDSIDNTNNFDKIIIFFFKTKNKK